MNTEEIKQQEEITREGDPSKPQGEAGAAMLMRMNESHANFTNWGLAFFNWHGNEQVLDIGCGGGATLGRLSKHVTTGHLTGVDYSEVSVKESQQFNAQDIARGKMDVVAGSVESLPFADNSFDKITTVESFYFWPNPQESLKEVCRVLKPQGTFLLIAEIYGHAGLSEKVQENIKRYHMTNPSVEEFKQLFEKAGFRDVVVHTQANEGWVCVEGHK